MHERRLEPGLLIAIEGIDGSGKSTQANGIAEVLRHIGLGVCVTREPTDGQYGLELRRSAREARLPADRELQLFLLDRQEHVETCIRPEVDAGHVVITDRYYFSTLAYQGARGFDRAELLRRNEAIAPKPDVLVILDVPVPIALERITRGRGEQPNTFEQAEQLEASRAIFLELANDFGASIVIDGDQEPDAIRADIVRALIDGVLGARLEAAFGSAAAAMRDDMLANV